MVNKILEFQTEQEALTCLDYINQMASAWWQSQGYTVIDGTLVGKNAKTGEDKPEKTQTSTWDTVKQSPDNTYYIFSLTGARAEWVNWKQNLEDNFGFTNIGVEKDFPEEWKPVEEI